MAGLLRGLVIACCLLWLVPSSAQGFGLRFFWRFRCCHSGPVRYSQPLCPTYSVVPVVYPVAVAASAPAAPAFATPLAAPPSQAQSPEPPLNSPKRAPSVSESRSLGGSYSSLASAGQDPQTCQVGFWNITGKDVTIQVDGQAHLLARDRALTLSLARNFTWQVDQSTAQREQVPTGNTTFEIVVRP